MTVFWPGLARNASFGTVWPEMPVLALFGQYGPVVPVVAQYGPVLPVVAQYGPVWPSMAQYESPRWCQNQRVLGGVKNQRVLVGVKPESPRW